MWEGVCGSRRAGERERPEERSLYTSGLKEHSGCTNTGMTRASHMENASLFHRAAPIPV